MVISFRCIDSQVFSHLALLEYDFVKTSVTLVSRLIYWRDTARCRSTF